MIVRIGLVSEQKRSKEAELERLSERDLVNTADVQRMRQKVTILEKVPTKFYFINNIEY